MTRNPTLALALGALLLAAGCTDAAKAPAEQALKAAEAAVSTLNDEVAQLAPQAAQAARDALADARTFAAKQDYKSALAAAGAVPAKVQAAFAAAGAAKDEAVRKASAAVQQAWTDASTALSGQLDALKAHLGKLAKAKKLPKGLTAAAVKKARTTFAALEKGFAELKAQAANDAAGATAKLGELSAKAAELAKSLKLK